MTAGFPGVQPLRLRAADPEDLEIVSAALQDSILPLADMTFLAAQQRFVMVVNRFKWEAGAVRLPAEVAPPAEAAFADAASSADAVTAGAMPAEHVQARAGSESGSDVATDELGPAATGSPTAGDGPAAEAAAAAGDGPALGEGEPAQGPVYLRTHCGVRFENVTAARRSGINLRDRGRLLSLLAIRTEPGAVLLCFAGGGMIRLETPGIDCRLEDIGEPWPTRLCPDHPFEEADQTS